MKSRVLAGVAIAFAALAIGTSQAGAKGGGGGGSPLTCNGTYTGGTYSSVTVPANGVCILNGVSVSGGATVGSKAYLESNGSTFGTDIVGNSALTIYLHGNSSVTGGNLAAASSAQVFVYNSSVHGNIGASNSVAPGYGHFQICGSSVVGNTSVSGFGPDILIGDPAASCGANTLMGDVALSSNPDYNELYLIGNSIRGDVTVSSNTGIGDKRVNSNTIHGNLSCSGNSAPFNGSGNNESGGQCTR